MTEGQRKALQQLERIAATDPRALEIVETQEQPAEGLLQIDVSVACDGIAPAPGGISLRPRERLRISVPEGFPFRKPGVITLHSRWAGGAHVQWGCSLCLYQAASDWNPSDGMFGFIHRLGTWLEAAAQGTLDPDDAPLHPPVAYTSSATLVVPRADTPTVVDTPWIGSAVVTRVGENRVDITGWDKGIDTLIAGAAIPAVLLPSMLTWEYPKSVSVLVDALEARGVPRRTLFNHLQFHALGTVEGQPLLVAVGTAMRGTAKDRRQHLAVWEIEPDLADTLRTTLKARLDEHPEIREIGGRLDEIVQRWALMTPIAWCRVREARAEVTRRRDEGSPMEWFAGKRVALWGCGALGGLIGEWVARSGAREIVLYDSSVVAPGILVRQAFADRDIGAPKARALAERLEALELPGLRVQGAVQNVIDGPLEIPPWHEDMDVVIDATASPVVRAKLERVRMKHPGGPPLVSMLVGAESRRAVAVVAGAGFSGGSADVFRQAKLACLRDPDLSEFAEDFWPDPVSIDRRPFQPEPGCSDVTFRGSQVEIAALAGTLLTRVAEHLAQLPSDQAAAELTTLPAIGVAGAARDRSLRFARATVVGGHDQEVRLSRGAWRAIQMWIARGQRTEVAPGSETGGVLFGERDEAAGVLWVDEVIGPPPDSSSSPEEFLCGVSGVAERARAFEDSGRGSLSFVGVWHTHPGGRAQPSPRDLQGVAEILAEQGAVPSEVLLLIVGGFPRVATPRIGAHRFSGEQISRGTHLVEVEVRPDRAAPFPPTGPQDIGLALSGGGSRAVAFHLGCLRALHDAGLLERVRVVSGVSGGSLAAALWAYGGGSFADFDERVSAILEVGLAGAIARRALLSPRLIQSAGTQVVAGGAALGARAASRFRRAGQRLLGRAATSRIDPPLRRWSSRTDAFSDVLATEFFGDLTLRSARRHDGLEVVLNACDLRTGSAFRFGSRESGCWRFGHLVRNEVALSEAVAASAAYPLFLPALDRRWVFLSRDGDEVSERVILSDGGLFDNLGTSVLEPDRSEAFSTNVFPDLRFVIACDAGRGILSPTTPLGALSRLQRSFETTHRKAQDGARSRLHQLSASGALEGVLIPYLGQQDRRLTHAPADLVPRSAVVDYPTNFSAMAPEDIALLARRGEQVTQALLAQYGVG